MEQKTTKGKILYIEDEVDACRTMIEFLNPRGFAVIISFTAEEAYGLLKKWNPDLVLLDLKLIGASGIDFVHKIQNEGIKIPVVIITAYPKKISEIEIRGLNIRGYYEKPYSYAELYKTIKQILEVR
ncbi:MAG: response regulator [Candidatus Omnitrophica bacterium]|nr:response regulator [Candidatus Omnitrophota bacterium]